MKINIVWFSLVICISFLISLTKSSSVSLRGIPPQDEDYFKTEIIKCKNGSKKFNRAQLNDDFCDCPDGTDEPGTSACPQGKFYCQNVGHIPTTVSSSRVNDGICDCCDGSDEYDGTVSCPNTCSEAGQVARDKLQKKIDMYKQGISVRKKEIEQAKRALSKDTEELLKLKDEKITLDKIVKQLKVQKEQVEKLKESELAEKEKEDATEKHVEEKDKDGDDSADDQKESLSSDDNRSDLSDEYLLDKTQTYEKENVEELQKDGSESTEGLSKEELGRLVASRWTGGKTEHPTDGTTKTNLGGSSETSESTKDGMYDSNSDKDSYDSNTLRKRRLDEQKDLSEINASSSSSWFGKIKDTVQNIFQSVNFSPPPVDKQDADRILKKYDDATTRLSDVEARISSLTEKLKHDFGTQNEFYLLYDQCFELKQEKYGYKVCPFKEASQEDYRKTRLGEWQKFENSYRTMLFSNGEGCWNGPDRSLKVKLRCGLKTELTDVDEPSRCEYTALMTTPAVCVKEKLEELKHKLEAIYKERQDGHDEL